MERYTPDSTHDALVIMGNPRALAYQWIVEYAKYISPKERTDDDDDGGYYNTTPVSAEELIEAANSHQDGGWGDYICRGGEYEGFQLDSTFWDKFAIVMGIERESVEERSFFTCSC